jgi:hypothetical protein
MASRVYKSLLKTINKTFKDDVRVKNAAIERVKREFREGDKGLDFARNVELVLKRNVVQAWEKPAAKGVYQLNITPDTELNDNETIRKRGGCSK